jgi:16S rRNA (uracil1498-N3)-methyltransferase
MRQGPSLTLVQALVKQDKLEEIVQHNTELGVHRFVLFAATRSVVKVTDRTRAQVERLSRIALDAARQCERSDVPTIEGPVVVSHLMPILAQEDGLVLIGEPREKNHLFDVLSNADVAGLKNVVLIVGPEGGLDDNETLSFTAKGAVPVQYARHVLRTQTAGLVGMSIIQSFFR